MHEYEELYSRWKKYRTKKRVTLLFTFLVGALLLLALYIYQNKDHTLAYISFKKTDRTNIILPDKHFEKHLLSSSQKYKTTNKRQDMKKISKNETLIASKKKKESQNTPKVQQSKTAPKQKSVLIKKETASIKELIDIFHRSPTAPKALIIAKRYYRQKMYDKAATWALKANQLDKKNEESWLLFAKALAKAGKEKQALELLNIYYKKTYSQKAYILLDQIRKGTIP